MAKASFPVGTTSMKESSKAGRRKAKRGRFAIGGSKGKKGLGGMSTMGDSSRTNSKELGSSDQSSLSISTKVSF